jgi:hypothetical protein
VRACARVRACGRLGTAWPELVPYIVATLGSPNPSVRNTSLLLLRHVVDYVGQVCCACSLDMCVPGR